MRQFSYVRAESAAQAVSAKGIEANEFLAGGSTLIDLVKLDVMQPETVVDINSLPLYDIEELADGRLKIGALVSNTALAYHPVVKEKYAVLSEALLSGASTSLRNKATTGGNGRHREPSWEMSQPRIGGVIHVFGEGRPIDKCPHEDKKR